MIEYSNSVISLMHNLVSETIYVCVMHFVPNVPNVAR